MNKLKVLEVENYSNCEFSLYVEDLNKRRFWVDASEVIFIQDLEILVGSIINAELSIMNIKKTRNKKTGIRLLLTKDGVIEYEFIGKYNKIGNKVIINVDNLIIKPGSTIKEKISNNDLISAGGLAYITKIKNIKDLGWSKEEKERKIKFTDNKTELDKIEDRFKRRRIKEKWL